MDKPEVIHRQQAFEQIDCRTCRNFRATEHCVSVLRCTDASAYQKTAPIQLWEESPVGDPPF